MLQVRGCWHLSPAEGGPRPVKLRVRRDVLLEDAYRGLKGQLQALKGRLQVHCTMVANCFRFVTTPSG